MFQDIVQGWRMMRKTPGVTAVACLTLTLGIGANTAMFSVMDAVLLRPLPYRDPDRLVTIRAQIPSRNIFDAFVEYNTAVEWWRAQARSFESMTAFTPGFTTLLVGSDPERVPMYRVNAGVLAMLGLRPAAGREFRPDEDLPGAPRVAMLSYALWQRRFGGDPAAVGRQILLDRQPSTVIGVAPAGFDLYGADIDLYAPIAASSARARGMPTVGVHARLKPGVSLASAQAEIDGLCRRWVQQYHYPSGWGARVSTVRDFLVRDVRGSIVVLGIAVGLVLLIACANVANLLLARAGARQREMAIRSALGAGRGRIVRQLLIESAMMGALAAILGLFAAWAGVRALAAGTAYLPLQKNVTVDVRVLAFTLGAALLMVLLFGLAPALMASHSRLAGNLKEGGRSGVEGRRYRRLRETLVVIEVALALLLAVGAALMARSVARLQVVDPGFNPAGLFKAYITLPAESYPDAAKRLAFFQALDARLQAIPGVTAAGLVSHLPFGGSRSGANIVVEGAPPALPGETLIAFTRIADPGYFPVLQGRLVRGRFFTPHDPSGGPVAIVNETMARKAWPNQDPVGKRFGGGGGNWVTVVGVVADMRQTALWDEPDPEWYMPLAQNAGATMALVVRTSGSALQLAPAVRAALRELDKDLPLADVGTVADSISHSVRSRRFSAAVLAGFAALSLLLAAVGIYGVISYSVARRTHEIGVRMALGAERARIAGMVVERALLLAAWGVAIGLAGGLALTRLLRSLLFGVSATDPLVFTAAALFLLAIAALAAWIPARRAARVEPCAALREE